MTAIKKNVLQKLPQIIEQVKEIAELEQYDENEFFRRVVDFYAQNKHPSDFEDYLGTCYAQMGAVNIAIAQEALIAENECEDNYIKNILLLNDYEKGAELSFVKRRRYKKCKHDKTR